MAQQPRFWFSFLSLSVGLEGVILIFSSFAAAESRSLSLFIIGASLFVVAFVLKIIALAYK